MKEINIKFDELGINMPILHGLKDLGFETPTEIQAEAIPFLLKENNDFVGQAQTGTGKTAAFGIPLLQNIDFACDDVQALILTPTRELALQVMEDLEKIGKYTDARFISLFGGTPYDNQLRKLKKDKPQVVVGTPGRVIDFLKKKLLKLGKANYCILDEADEMLTMGFLEDVHTILEFFKPKKQLIMFSATMPKPILKMIQNSFNQPYKVSIEKKTLSNEDIEQKYFIVRDKHFKEGLSRLIDIADDLYGIVFCRTKIETRDVADDLKKRGHSVEVLNGDMAQPERDLAMRRFKTKKCNIMVCTDVAARGIDITNLTHVFNYGLPRDNESYVHRIGRTGRAGLKGVAYTLVGPGSIGGIRLIEKHTNKKMTQEKLPTVEVLKHKLVEREIAQSKQILLAIRDKGDEFKTEESFELFKKEFGELDQDDFFKLMFVWKFNKEMRRYNNLSDIESQTSKSSKPKKPKRNSRLRNPRQSNKNKGK